MLGLNVELTWGGNEFEKLVYLGELCLDLLALSLVENGYWLRELLNFEWGGMRMLGRRLAEVKYEWRRSWDCNRL